MDTKDLLKTQLVTDFNQNITSQKDSVLYDVRKKAFETFENLSFPTTKHEEWKYSNVKNLINQNFTFSSKNNFTEKSLDVFEIPNLEGNILYFINGIYNENLSKIVSPASEITIMKLSDATVKFPELVSSHFNTYNDNTINAFSALNTALASEGVFVHVPENSFVVQPIIVRYITDSNSENVGFNNRNLIIVEKNAELQIAESFRSIGENSVFTNIITEFYVKDSAKVHYYKVQNESNNSFHIGTTNVVQKDHSVFSANTVTANGGFVRNNLNIKIDGEFAEANMFGLYIPDEKQHIDNHTVVDHAKPNSNSNEFYKGILNGNSTGVFNGKIFVREDAQKTNAFQSCKNVLASENASMNTKPQLEIWADDVKCSHGTTTGQLNEDALFYLQSRGISKESAKSLLMLAFTQDVIDKMEIPAIKEYLQTLVAEKIQGL
ncbi:MAG: Fe-S cluster assembly protein SufD [Pseudarcicella sp.]|nr:Fe-S cluster assembly protein SufD [Pseudarcicella sp.]MBP6409595.1 Fe-S cluster assembly protein SufD [Pseudarcicella sp.]